MKSIDWTDRTTDNTASESNGRTYSASRVLVGKCPDCQRVLVVFNDGESWPLVACACGWQGGTTEFPSVRVDGRGRPVSFTVRGLFDQGEAMLRIRRDNGDDVTIVDHVEALGLYDMNPQRWTGTAILAIEGRDQ